MRKRYLKITFVFLTLVTLATVVFVFLNKNYFLYNWRLNREFTFKAVNKGGLREFKHNLTGIVFVEVPSGNFLMGSPESEEGRDLYEGPVHNVKLSRFLIAKYETSVKNWKKVMGNTGGEDQHNNHPITSVSWEEVIKFCEKSGLTLPTEEQWEYACRAGTETPFSTGDTLLKEHSNFKYGVVSDFEKIKPVNSFLPNHWGLHNMHGNVEEMCLNKKYVYPIKDSKLKAAIEEELSKLPESRAIRGGSWLDDQNDCRSANRAFISLQEKRIDAGFRLVWNYSK